MIKKIMLALTIVFLFSSIGFTEEPPTETYMEIPTTSRHIEQIEWAYDQGYMWGMLASYGCFNKSPWPGNFVLPIIKTAWETGYIKAVIDIQQNSWAIKDEK